MKRQYEWEMTGNYYKHSEIEDHDGIDIMDHVRLDEEYKVEFKEMEKSTLYRQILDFPLLHYQVIRNDQSSSYHYLIIISVFVNCWSY